MIMTNLIFYYKYDQPNNQLIFQHQKLDMRSDMDASRHTKLIGDIISGSKYRQSKNFSTKN